MYSVLLTYGLNPIEGLKVMVRNPERMALLKQVLAQRCEANLSVGALVPEGSERMSLLELATKLKFFVALEGEEERQELKALPAGSTSTGLQIYSHEEGDTRYKAEVMRWKLGKRTRSRSYR